MSRLFVCVVALSSFACGEKPAPAKAPASAAATNAAPAVETEAALRDRYAAEAKQAITPENASQVADDLLKEIAADQ